MENELGFSSKAYRLNKIAIHLYAQEECLLGAALPFSQISDILYAAKRFDSALWYINKSIGLYEQVGYKGNIDEFYERQSKIYAAMFDYKNALASTAKAKNERERKYTAETTKSIMEIENRYENKLKEEKIRTLTADNLLAEKRTFQNKIIFWSIFLILISVLAGLIAYLKQRANILRQLKEKAMLDKVITQSLENRLKEVQLQALQSQMNPHFIYNALSSIQSLILQEDKENAITYLNDFAQLSRLTLENSRKERIKLKDEIKFLQRYLELESLRHNFQFAYKFEVAPDIDTEIETIPPMLIQPVVENAIKHGLNPKKGGGQLNIRFKITDDESMVCIVEDNGVGRAKSMEGRTTSSYDSISTEVNETRLKLISDQQDLKKRYRMDIQDKYDEYDRPSGTLVVIFFGFVNSNLQISDDKNNNY